jgi:U4/U6.U5 tri-snRNP-associated protein 2
VRTRRTFDINASTIHMELLDTLAIHHIRTRLQKFPMSSESDFDENPKSRKKQRAQKSETIEGLYLESVNRSVLDFDFENLCSVSLSNINVYACLVCGKYFQGRGIHSHAYYHSINDDHHVFINLESLKVYVLPDGYEVRDSSFSDIKVSFC